MAGLKLNPYWSLVGGQKCEHDSICQPQEEDTMMAEKALGWIGYLIKGMKRVVVVYGKSGDFKLYDLHAETLTSVYLYIYVGEVIQMCVQKDKKCLSILDNAEDARALALTLGLRGRQKEKMEDEGVEAMEENTEEL